MTEVWHVDYLVSTTCAYLLSVIFNYFASMRFVYTRKEEMTHSRAFSIFLGLSAVGLLLNDGFMYLMTTIASVDYRVSKLAVTFGVSLFNFFTRRHFLDAQPAHIRAW
jgi:putative flippase GtrA